MHTTIIESLIVSPGENSILAQLAEEAVSFQDEQLREGRGPIINEAQFIRAVASNMKQLRLFTTASNRAGAQSGGAFGRFLPKISKLFIATLTFVETVKE